MSCTNIDTELLLKIKNLKNQQFKNYFIDCHFKELNYSLVLLTSDCDSKIELMKLLGQWRKNNEYWFPAIFKITLNGTISWFKKKVIEAPDRLLFLIQVGNEYIGHIGLFRYDCMKKSIEIDNIVRGEPQYPGIMENAIIYMMNWGYKTLKIKGYSLTTFSDNIKALNLYHKLGFIEKKRIPYIKIKREDIIEWIPAPNDYIGQIERFNIYMELNP